MSDGGNVPTNLDRTEKDQREDAKAQSPKEEGVSLRSS
jgi:hypothetical protein